MKEIVWVFGPSAAGKETFVRLASEPEGENLRNRLGWKGKKVVPCWESIEWIGKRKIDNDPIVAMRNRLIPAIQKVVSKVDVVLIKGQGVDLTADRPNRLLMAEPMKLHRVIYMSVGITELMYRLPSKPWWDNSDTSDDILKWVDYELGMLQKINQKIEIVAISGSSDKNYEFVGMPERLRDR